MNKAVLRWILLLLLPSLVLPAFAQEILKNPRVVELEDALKNSASEYVKSRFPTVPFMVSVRVDPLRRDPRSMRDGDNEALPYFSDDSDDETRDEWDNPQVPLNALINRVKRIKVTISVPASIKESEVNELKDNIVNVLHLTPARDEIEISRRDWTIGETPWMQLVFAASITILFLLGLLLINRSSANRISTALANLKPAGRDGSKAMSAMPQPQSGGMEKGAGSRQSQELKFNDPVKMKELATRHIEFLTSSKAFPNHRDMFILDQLGKLHPDKLGAVVVEFPAPVQQKIFAYSAAFHWVEALNDPGFLDFECLEVYQSLMQNSRSPEESEWSQAILAVWRLNDARSSFLKSLGKEEAFAVLSQMPKSIAVSEARRTFPGAWAAILDPDFKPVTVKKERAKQIHDQAVALLPLHDIQLVQKYREEKDLVQYLKLVDPLEERDIYGAVASNSIIHKIRPPFFPLFDQDEQSLQWFAAVVDLEVWALALFNVPKSERSKIDSHFSEKQKFLFVERLKQFDANPPSREDVGGARERVGAIFKNWQKDKQQSDEVNGSMDEIFNTAANNDEGHGEAA
jgi:hypothetical protein